LHSSFPPRLPHLLLPCLLILLLSPPRVVIALRLPHCHAPLFSLSYLCGGGLSLCDNRRRRGPAKRGEPPSRLSSTLYLRLLDCNKLDLCLRSHMELEREETLPMVFCLGGELVELKRRRVSEAAESRRLRALPNGPQHM
jgi:hypothetical protein